MKKTKSSNLPQVAAECIDSVMKHMKYRKKVRAEVREELNSHFTDALADCETEEEKQQAAEEMIVGFGDFKLLGTLMRRAKKRCRPLWQKVMVMMLEIIGIIILLLLLRVGYMAAGRPTISVDYTQRMNDEVRDGREESLNAYHDYQKAIILLPEEFPSEIEEIDRYSCGQETTAEDWLTIETFLETQTEAINEFRKGAAKPYYWDIYQSSKDAKNGIENAVCENMYSFLFSGYCKLIDLIHFQILLDLHKGHDRQAIDDTLTLCRFGRHQMSPGILIEGLWGIAFESIAWSRVYDLLTQIDVQAEDLLHFQNVIEEHYDPHSTPIDWSIEKIFWYDQIQRMFTDDGHGNGRPLPKGTTLVAAGLTDYVKGFIVGFPSRQSAIAEIDKLFSEAEKARQITPWMLHSQSCDFSELDRFIEKSGIMQKRNFPQVKKIVEISWHVRAMQGGIIGTLAILRFEKENGRLPDGWDQLFEKGYLKTIPMDPYSDKPLVYRKTENGFILYSVGLNFTDDGGVPGTDKNGKPRIWGDNGDQIFWPVE